MNTDQPAQNPGHQPEYGENHAMSKEKQPQLPGCFPNRNRLWFFDAITPKRCNNRHDGYRATLSFLCIVIISSNGSHVKDWFVFKVLCQRPLLPFRGFLSLCHIECWQHVDNLPGRPAAWYNRAATR